MISNIRAFLLIITLSLTGALAQIQDLEKRIVLPNLVAWTQQRTTAIVNANTNADIQAAIDAFISKSVTIQINGQKVKRSDYIKTLQANLPGRLACNVTYNSMIAVPTDAQKPISAGWIGAFYVANDIYPSQTVTQSVSDNMLIQQDPSIPVPTAVGGIHGDFDGRRVTAINRVTTVV